MSEREEGDLYRAKYKDFIIVCDGHSGNIKQYIDGSSTIDYRFCSNTPFPADCFYMKIVTKLGLEDCGLRHFLPQNRKPWDMFFGVPYFQSIEDLLEFHENINKAISDPLFSKQKLRDTYERERIGLKNGS